jgi:hypothetical protein
MLAATMSLIVADQASARPQFGTNCASCHVLPPPNASAPDAVGFDTSFNPDETLTGKPDRGIRPVYDVMPGQSVDLEMLVNFLVTIAPQRYAVSLRNTHDTGVVIGGNLVFTADTDWTHQTGTVIPSPATPYYTIPAGAVAPSPASVTWVNGTPVSYVFTMTVDMATLPDYYYMEFVVGGRTLTAGPAQLFNGVEGFYLHVLPEPSSLMLLGLGATALLARRRRSRNQL